MLDIAKKMGLKAHVEKKRELKLYPIPDDEGELDNLLNESESNFEKGNYFTSKKMREKVELFGKKKLQVKK